MTQLKDEFKVRGEKQTGNKVWLRLGLRRRLHGAMLRVHLAAAAAAAAAPHSSFYPLTKIGRALTSLWKI